MTEEIAFAYAAGIIDADGSIYIGKSGKYHQLGVKIGMSSSAAVDYIEYHFGGYVNTNFHKALNKDQFVWSLSGSKAKLFLEQLLPYLKVKQEQARIALNYPVGIRGRPVSEDDLEQREAIRRVISKLNGKTPVETRVVVAS